MSQPANRLASGRPPCTAAVYRPVTFFLSMRETVKIVDGLPVAKTVYDCLHDRFSLSFSRQPCFPPRVAPLRFLQLLLCLRYCCLIVHADGNQQ